MKKKGMTYLLVLGVVAVWAVIIRKLILSAQEEQIPHAVTNTRTGHQETLKWYMVSYPDDSVAVQEIRRDPFSGMEESKTVSQQMPAPTVQNVPVVKPAVVWPQIVFQGFSSKRAQKSGKYAILTVNNQPFMLAEGEEALGITLKKNWGDSLMLSFQKKNKTLYLQTK